MGSKILKFLQCNVGRLAPLRTLRSFGCHWLTGTNDKVARHTKNNKIFFKFFSLDISQHQQNCLWVWVTCPILSYLTPPLFSLFFCSVVNQLPCIFSPRPESGVKGCQTCSSPCNHLVKHVFSAPDPVAMIPSTGSPYVRLEALKVNNVVLICC